MSGRGAPSGGGLLGDLSLLEDPDRVAEGVADAQVGAVEVVGGLLGEIGDATRLQGLEQAADVVRLEDEAVHRALGDQLADLRTGGLVVERRARLLEVDRDPGLAGDADRQPAVGALLEVVADLEPELVHVEVERLVLVEDVDRGDVQVLDHFDVPAQPTARFTSAAIFASSAAVSFFSANEVGQKLPSSSWAASSKPNVA